MMELTEYENILNFVNHGTGTTFQQVRLWIEVILQPDWSIASNLNDLDTRCLRLRTLAT